MRNISASKLALMAACPASHVLPWVDDNQSASALKGTRIHSYLEHRFAGETVDWGALGIPPYVRKICLQIDLNKIIDGLTDVRTEVAVAYAPDTRTSRVLGERIGRKYDRYGRLPGEPAGSIDLVGRRHDGVPVVEDFKTGRHVGPVQDHMQTRFLALAVAQIHGEKTCVGRIGYIDWYGAYTQESYTFDALDFAETEDIIGNALSEVEKSRSSLKMVVGEHCDKHYCPARANCPAYKEQVAA